MYSSEKLNNLIENTAKEIGINIHKGSAHTVEAFYQRKNEDKHYTITEMECYSLFLNANILQKQASAIVTVTDTDTEKLDPKERENKLDQMIKLALESIIKF